MLHQRERPLRLPGQRRAKDRSYRVSKELGLSRRERGAESIQGDGASESVKLHRGQFQHQGSLIKAERIQRLAAKMPEHWHKLNEPYMFRQREPCRGFSKHAVEVPRGVRGLRELGMAHRQVRGSI